MTATLLTALVLGIGFAVVVAGLQRHHARDKGFTPRLFGSAGTEDRDLSRVRADLEATDSARFADPPGTVRRAPLRSVHLSAR